MLMGTSFSTLRVCKLGYNWITLGMSSPRYV